MAGDLGNLGEFGFIAELRKRFPPGEGVAVGIGDDAALAGIDGDALITTDMLVEGVHFDAEYSSARDVGFKAMACSASDIAAMGGKPRYAVIALGTPEHPALDPIEISAGIEEAAAALGFSVVGGDTTSAPVMVASVTMIGVAARSGAVLRSTARAGDLLCVTGTLGAASAALALFRRADAASLDVLQRTPSLAEAHRRGRARVREGSIAAGLATAMIDVSDGLGADADHLAEESGLGIRVQAENIPTADGVAEAAVLLGIPVEQFTLSGGDDYELLIAVSPHDVSDLREALAPTRLSIIGELNKDGDRYAELPGGVRMPLKSLGWDHFR